METNGLPKLDNVIFGEIQVLLAEKRTALASLRTGIAIFALPLSVLSVLIATSDLIRPPLLVARESQTHSNGVDQIVASNPAATARERCVPEAVISQR